MACFVLVQKKSRKYKSGPSWCSPLEKEEIENNRRYREVIAKEAL
tara:strand:- start:298 stop:432 length:135 start_codon:yes stop_codon:yes gene_type:complete